MVTQFSFTRLLNLYSKGSDKRNSLSTYIHTLFSKCKADSELKQLISDVAKHTTAHEVLHRQCALTSLSVICSCFSDNPNTIALYSHLSSLITPIINQIYDLDDKVRLTCFESIIYISKSINHHILPYSYTIFKALVNGVVDTSPEVIKAALHLDRVFKDIILNNTPHFSLSSMIPLISQTLHLPLSSSRCFCLRFLMFILDCLNIDIFPFLHTLLHEVSLVVKDFPSDHHPTTPSSSSEERLFVLGFVDQEVSFNEVCSFCGIVTDGLYSKFKSLVPVEEDQNYDVSNQFNDPLSSCLFESPRPVVSMSNAPQFESVDWESLSKTILNLLTSNQYVLIKEGCRWLHCFQLITLRSKDDRLVYTFSSMFPLFLSGLLKLINVQRFYECAELCEDFSLIFDGFVDFICNSNTKPNLLVSFSSMLNVILSMFPPPVDFDVDQKGETSLERSNDFKPFPFCFRILDSLISHHFFSIKSFCSPLIRSLAHLCFILPNQKLHLVQLLDSLLYCNDSKDTHFESIFFDEICNILIYYSVSVTLFTDFLDIISNSTVLEINYLFNSIISGLIPVFSTDKWLNFQPFISQDVVPLLCLSLLSNKYLIQTRIDLFNAKEESIGDLFELMKFNSICCLIISMYSGFYSLALKIISKLSEELTNLHLELLDRFLLLIESPSFSNFRLRLLTPQHRNGLLSVLIGISFLVPPSTSFDVLMKRINATQCLNSLSEVKCCSSFEEKFIDRI
ncbi:hypothetical protein P9112_002587 [Eukaryota sp. TZLM1-RC]